MVAFSALCCGAGEAVGASSGWDGGAVGCDGADAVGGALGLSVVGARWLLVVMALWLVAVGPLRRGCWRFDALWLLVVVCWGCWGLGRWGGLGS